VFLVNSWQKIFRCGPAPHSTFEVRIRASNSECGAGQALSLTYGRFFAEFLEDLSLVRLTLLELTTCVGLRYGRYILKLRSFSRNRALYSFLLRRRELSLRLEYVSSGFT
jgi:hypothetical protein